MLDAIIEKFQEGFSHFFEVILEGIIPSAIPIIISGFFNSGIFPSDYILIFYLLSGVASLIGIIKLIEEMSFWGISYIIGWLVGVIFLADSGLLKPWDFVLYLISPLVFLGYKILKRIEIF